MKKLFAVLTGLMFLVACSNNGGESGAVNDGFSGVADTNGGLPDTPNTKPSPSIDTAKGDHRVDIEARDSATQRR